MIEASDLRKLGTLNPFSDADLGLLLTVCRARSLASGSVLYVQGERAQSCFLLVRGRLQVERARVTGRQVIATLQPGTFVGQIALIDHGKRTASVRATTECEGLELSAEVVNQLMSGCAPLSLAFQDQLAVAGIRQFRQAMALIAAIPAARESVDAQRRRDLDQVQACLTELGVTLEELDGIECVRDHSR